jgi:hypothetical protein
VQLLIRQLGRNELEQLAALSTRELHDTVHGALISVSLSILPLQGDDGKLIFSIRRSRARAKKMVAGRRPVRPVVKRKH